MPVQHVNSISATNGSAAKHYEAIVVGAGFGGIRMLYELCKLGISVKVLEAGTDVGGTWYWNRYPGARTDSESWIYIMNFSEELKAEWNWNERYSTQPEIQTYLAHVVDRFDMRKHIQFSTRVKSALYNEKTSYWTLITDEDETFTCTYFIAATGRFFIPQQPQYPGLDKFQGEWYIPSRWPKEPVDFTDKRVAVIGTGSTGVHVVPIVAHTASHVTVFQRTPAYVLPSRNYPLTEAQRSELRRKHDQIWSLSRRTLFALGPANRKINDVTPTQQQQILEAGWEVGGLRYLFETFDDLFSNPKCNQITSDFVRNKIRAIVKDAKTAETLCPQYPLLAKRPALGHHYYETYNRDNVKLVDISRNHIQEITATGIRTDDAEYECDMIIFAMGFDVGTGSLAHMDIRGKNGLKLADKWVNGPETFLGIGIEGFPNMFMITGPHTPASNAPVIIDDTVTWIGRAMIHIRNKGYSRMEPEHSATEEWGECVNAAFFNNLMSNPEELHSYVIGANIPGKPRSVLFYVGGVEPFINRCQLVADSGFEGFTFTA